MVFPGPDPAPSVLRFGVFELDPRSGELRRAGARVRLKPQPFKVLALLATRAGQVVTREEIQREVWGEGTFVDFDQGVNQCVREIRAALADDAEGPRFVETLPRRGYRFLAPVEIVRAEPPQLSPTASRSGAAGVRSVRSRAVVGVAVLFIAAAALTWSVRTRARGPAGRAVLAVLPFENLIGDTGQDYLVDGVTEEVITQLGRLDPQRLGVISRSSAMTYKGAKKTAAEVGRELGADYILEGSVRRTGERVRITAQLIDTRDATHLWAENYDREVAGVLAVQSEVAGAVARAIQLTLTPQQQARLAAPRPVNREVLEAYLKGRYFWNKRAEGALKTGIDYFQQAVEKDPSYALAYTGLADSYIVLGTTLYGALPPTEAMPKAKAAAERALALDGTLAEAHTSLAFARFYYDWDWAGAEAGFKRAIELNPNYSTTHQWYALHLAALGRMDEAIAETKRARELDPLSLTVNTIQGRVLYYADQSDGAIAQLRKTIDLDPRFHPAHVFLGLAHEQRGSHHEAIAEFERAVQLSTRDPVSLGLLAHAYGISGEIHQAKNILRELEQLSNKRYVSPMNIAWIHAGLRSNDQAFAWLQRAYEERSGWLVHLNNEPVFDSLRSDPRFTELARRVGLS